MTRLINNTHVHTSQDALEKRIRDVVGALRKAIDGVLNGLPGSPHRTQELARVLHVNKTLASRIGQAIRTPDPLACAHKMPGPEALRILLNAASRKGAGKSVVAQAEAVIGEFDQLLRRDFGSRDGLDAFISHSLPSARAKFELANKQAMFKAAANLKGAYAETHLSTMIIHPGDDPDRYDWAEIHGMFGLRRMRPVTEIHLTNEHVTSAEAPRSRITIDGCSVEGMRGLLLEKFCSSPPPRIKVKCVPNCVHYTLGGEGVGPGSAQDLVYAQIVPAMFYRYKLDEGPRKRGAFANVEQPVKTLVFDMLLHKDVWPNAVPELKIYDTITHGSADPNDPARDCDLLDLVESLENMGQSTTRFRIEELPNYLEMLDYLCDKLNWNGEDLRGYRCRIQYPFHGCQVSVVFEPPEKPAD